MGTPYKMKGSPMQRNYGIGSPAKKALVGKQANLPEELKAKIDASPGKMYDSPAKHSGAEMYSTKNNKTITRTGDASRKQVVEHDAYHTKYPKDTNHTSTDRSTGKGKFADKEKKSPAKIAPLIAMAGKAILGKVAGKVAGKVMGEK